MKNLILILVLLISSIANTQWVNIRPQLNTKFYQTGGITYMLTGTTTEGYIYSTTNEGTTWNSLSGVILNSGTLYSFALKNTTTIVVGTSSGIKYYNNTLYQTSNVTWETRSVICDGTNFYAGTSQGVYKSTNNGANWTSLGDLSGISVSIILKAETTFFASVGDLYKSTNGGSNWINTNMPGGVCMTYGNGTLWTGGMNGSNGVLYRSINLGTNWIEDNLGYLNDPKSIVTNGTDVYISTNNSKNVFHGYLQGSTYSYVLRNAGFPTQRPRINCMVVTYNHLLAGADSAIWRSPLAYVTEIKPQVTPVKFVLEQNYPNPFNASTEIRYQIPKEGTITLKIYDITGKELETLVNEKQSPGTYEVNWNASKYSSGVYFYKIETKGFIDTKRMLLVK